MPAEECFPIGALSEQSDVNIETIRYYERVGLLPKPERSAGRLSPVIDRLIRIGFASFAAHAILAFSLDEIRRLLDLADQKVEGRAAACMTSLSIIWPRVRTKIADLRRMERVSGHHGEKRALKGRCPACPAS